MIQQSQNYFAAAVSAALINAAAIAAFVLITLISSTQGFLLKDVLGAIGSITPSSQVEDSASSTGSASRDALLRSGAFSVTRSGSDRAAAAGGESTSSDAATGRGSVHQSHANSLSGPAGGTSGSGGSASGGPGSGSPGGDPLGSGDPLGGAPSLPSTPPPSTPPAVGTAAEGIGSTVTGLPSTLNGSASDPVGDGPGDLLGENLSIPSPSGSSVTSSQSGGSALLGSGSATSQVTDQIGGAVSSTGVKLPGLN